MISKIILGGIFKALAASQAKVVATAGKEEAIANLKEKVRVEFLTHVTKMFTEEMQHNIVEYVKNLEKISAEFSVPSRDIRVLNFKFEKMLFDFSKIFEERVKSSPVVDLIERKAPKKSLSVVNQPAQEFPILAWVNKKISPPASYQPYTLRQTELDRILVEVARIYDSIDIDHI
jgi:hypothetical protein